MLAIINNNTMKKIFIILCFLIAAQISFSQEYDNIKFNLTPNGTLVGDDGKDYIVLEYPSLSQSDLYNKFLIAVTKLYVSPKDVISKVENNIISVRGNTPYSSENAIRAIALGITLYYDASYVLKFEFKDGRVKVSAPTILNVRSSLNNDILPFCEWVKINRFFSFKKVELTGNEKKDKKRQEKAEKANERKMIAINSVNKLANSLIQDVIDNAVNKSEDNW